MGMWGRVLAVVFAAVWVLSATAPAHGGDDGLHGDVGGEEQAAESAVSDWTFVVAPYLWITGVQGFVTIDGTTADIDSSVGDTFDLLGSLEAGGAMAHIDIRNDRLGFFVDFAFMAINTTNAFGPNDLGSVRAKVLEYFVEYGATYRFLEYPTSLGPQSPIWVELLAGGRWNRISSELAFARLPSDLKSKIEFMDPIVGGRFVVPFAGSPDTGDFGVMFRGDIGGFGAGSDLSWNLIGALEWDMPWTLAGADLAMLAGYKTYYFRDEQISDGTSTAIALQMGGPMLGLAAVF